MAKEIIPAYTPSDREKYELERRARLGSAVL
jgi:hypothetical protein